MIKENKLEKGRVFTSLTIIRRLDKSELSKYGLSTEQNNPFYLCKCLCGKECAKVKHALLSGQAKYCKTKNCQFGQMGNKTIINIVADQKFDKLTVIRELDRNEIVAKGYKSKNRYIECICICETVVIRGLQGLYEGEITSCGCDKTFGAKHSPKITSALVVFRWSYQQEGDTISFDEFYELSQKDCYYCGTKPSKTHNAFKDKKHKRQQTQDNADFIFNGLDRLDSSLSHTKDNCVPCCFKCNSAKKTMTVENFIEWRDRVYNTLKIKGLI